VSGESRGVKRERLQGGYSERLRYSRHCEERSVASTGRHCEAPKRSEGQRSNPLNPALRLLRSSSSAVILAVIASEVKWSEAIP
jgi:hypothetical protein